MSENPELTTENLITGTSALPYLQFASILLKGLEKLAEIQKSTLDLYDRYSPNALGAAESIRMFPVAPVPLFEIAEEAIRAFLQLQVHILDLMYRQCMAQMDAVGANGALEYDRNVARLMRDSADNLVEMNRKALEFFTQQNQSFAAEICRQPNLDQARLLAEIQSDTDAIIQAQKRFWDVTLKPFKMLRAEGPRGSESTAAAR